MRPTPARMVTGRKPRAGRLRWGRPEGQLSGLSSLTAARRHPPSPSSPPRLVSSPSPTPPLGLLSPPSHSSPATATSLHQLTPPQPPDKAHLELHSLIPPLGRHILRHDERPVPSFLGVLLCVGRPIPSLSPPSIGQLASGGPIDRWVGDARCPVGGWRAIN